MSAEPYFWERRKLARAVASERRLSHRDTPNFAKIVIADTGPGIAAEFHQDIFEQFVRVGGKRTDGVGLGLSLSREIVVAHGGKIWVESAPGEGARFCLLLPLAHEAKLKTNGRGSEPGNCG